MPGAKFTQIYELLAQVDAKQFKSFLKDQDKAAEFLSELQKQLDGLGKGSGKPPKQIEEFVQKLKQAQTLMQGFAKGTLDKSLGNTDKLAKDLDGLIERMGKLAAVKAALVKVDPSEQLFQSFLNEPESQKRGVGRPKKLSKIDEIAATEQTKSNIKARPTRQLESFTGRGESVETIGALNVALKTLSDTFDKLLVSNVKGVAASARVSDARIVEREASAKTRLEIEKLVAAYETSNGPLTARRATVDALTTAFQGHGKAILRDVGASAEYVKAVAQANEIDKSTIKGQESLSAAKREAVAAEKALAASVVAGKGAALTPELQIKLYNQLLPLLQKAAIGETQLARIAEISAATLKKRAENTTLLTEAQKAAGVVIKGDNLKTQAADVARLTTEAARLADSLGLTASFGKNAESEFSRLAKEAVSAGQDVKFLEDRLIQLAKTRAETQARVKDRVDANAPAEARIAQDTRAAQSNKLLSDRIVLEKSLTGEIKNSLAASNAASLSQKDYAAAVKSAVDFGAKQNRPNDQIIARLSQEIELRRVVAERVANTQIALDKLNAASAQSAAALAKAASFKEDLSSVQRKTDLQTKLTDSLGTEAQLRQRILDSGLDLNKIIERSTVLSLKNKDDDIQSVERLKTMIAGEESRAKSLAKVNVQEQSITEQKRKQAELDSRNKAIADQSSGLIKRINLTASLVEVLTKQGKVEEHIANTGLDLVKTIEQVAQETIALGKGSDYAETRLNELLNTTAFYNKVIKNLSATQASANKQQAGLDKTQEIRALNAATESMTRFAKAQNIVSIQGVNVRAAVEGAATAMVKYGFSTAQAEKHLLELVKAQTLFNDNPSKAGKGGDISNLGSMFLLSQIAGTLNGAITTLTTRFSEFEAKLTEVRKTAGATVEATEALRDHIFEIAQQTPIAAEELATAAGILGQVGALQFDPARPVAEFVTESAKAIKVIAEVRIASDLSIEQAATSYGQLASIFSESVSRIKKELTGLTGTSATTADAMRTLFGAINEVTNATVATFGDVNEFIQNFGGVAASAGVSAEAVFGIGGAIRDLGVSSQVAGTALSALFGQMTSKAEVFADAMGQTVDEFNAGFLTDAEGTLLRFLKTLGEVSKERRNQIVGDLAAEQRQRNLILKLSGSYELLASRIDLVKNKTATNYISITREAEKFTETFSAKIQKLSNSVSQLAASFQPFFGVFGAFIDIANGAVQALDSFLRIPYIGPFTAGLVGIGLAAGGVLASIILFKKTLEFANPLEELKKLGGLFRINKLLLDTSAASSAKSAAAITASTSKQITATELANAALLQKRATENANTIAHNNSVIQSSALDSKAARDRIVRIESFINTDKKVTASHKIEARNRIADTRLEIIALEQRAAAARASNAALASTSNVIAAGPIIAAGDAADKAGTKFNKLSAGIGGVVASAVGLLSLFSSIESFSNGDYLSGIISGVIGLASALGTIVLLGGGPVLLKIGGSLIKAATGIGATVLGVTGVVVGFVASLALLWKTIDVGRNGLSDWDAAVQESSGGLKTWATFADRAWIAFRRFTSLGNSSLVKEFDADIDKARASMLGLSQQLGIATVNLEGLLKNAKDGFGNSALNFQQVAGIMNDLKDGVLTVGQVYEILADKTGVLLTKLIALRQEALLAADAAAATGTDVIKINTTGSKEDTEKSAKAAQAQQAAVTAQTARAIALVSTGLKEQGHRESEINDLLEFRRKSLTAVLDLAEKFKITTGFILQDGVFIKDIELIRAEELQKVHARLADQTDKATAASLRAADLQAKNDKARRDDALTYNQAIEASSDEGLRKEIVNLDRLQKIRAAIRNGSAVESAKEKSRLKELETLINGAKQKIDNLTSDKNTFDSSGDKERLKKLQDDSDALRESSAKSTNKNDRAELTAAADKIVKSREFIKLAAEEARVNITRTPEIEYQAQLIGEKIKLQAISLARLENERNAVKNISDEETKRLKGSRKIGSDAVEKSFTEGTRVIRKLQEERQKDLLASSKDYGAQLVATTFGYNREIAERQAEGFLLEEHAVEFLTRRKELFYRDAALVAIGSIQEIAKVYEESIKVQTDLIKGLKRTEETRFNFLEDAANKRLNLLKDELAVVRQLETDWKSFESELKNVIELGQGDAETPIKKLRKEYESTATAIDKLLETAFKLQDLKGIGEAAAAGIKALTQSAFEAGRAMGKLIFDQKKFEETLNKGKGTKKGRLSTSFLADIKAISTDRKLTDFERGKRIETAISKFRQDFEKFGSKGGKNALDIDAVLNAAESVIAGRNSLGKAGDAAVGSSKELTLQAEKQSKLYDDANKKLKDREIALKRLSALNQQIAKLEADRATKEAAANTGKKLDEQVVIAESPQSVELRKQRDALRTKIDSTTATGEDRPRSDILNAEGRDKANEIQSAEANLANQRTLHITEIARLTDQESALGTALDDTSIKFKELEKALRGSTIPTLDSISKIILDAKGLSGATVTEKDRQDAAKTAKSVTSEINSPTVASLTANTQDLASKVAEQDGVTGLALEAVAAGMNDTLHHISNNTDLIGQIKTRMDSYAKELSTIQQKLAGAGK